MKKVSALMLCVSLVVGMVFVWSLAQLTFQISIENVALQLVEPGNRLISTFDINVIQSEQGTPYVLEEVSVRIEIWKHRSRVLDDGTQVVDKRKLESSVAQLFTLKENQASLSISGAQVDVISNFCSLIQGALSEDAGWFNGPNGPADGFFLRFIVTVEGIRLENNLPVFGTGDFTVPFDHQRLCAET